MSARSQLAGACWRWGEGHGRENEGMYLGGWSSWGSSSSRRDTGGTFAIRLYWQCEDKARDVANWLIRPRLKMDELGIRSNFCCMCAMLSPR
jgi:hypothetical protein